MAKVVKRTFSLTADQAAFIDAKVESGGYASGSEVVRQGLRGMQAESQAIERWLREEVVPAIKEYEADPSRAVPIDEAFAELLSEFEDEDREQRDRKREKKAPVRKRA